MRPMYTASRGENAKSHEQLLCGGHTGLRRTTAVRCRKVAGGRPHT
jgi:hypothetical protein